LNGKFWILDNLAVYWMNIQIIMKEVRLPFVLAVVLFATIAREYLLPKIVVWE